MVPTMKSVLPTLSRSSSESSADLDPDATMSGGSSNGKISLIHTPEKSPSVYRNSEVSLPTLNQKMFELQPEGSRISRETHSPHTQTANSGTSPAAVLVLDAEGNSPAISLKRLELPSPDAFSSYRMDGVAEGVKLHPTTVKANSNETHENTAHTVTLTSTGTTPPQLNTQSHTS